MVSRGWLTVLTFVILDPRTAIDTTGWASHLLSRGGGFDRATTLGKLFTPLSPSSRIWYRSVVVTVCGWAGNRRSGVVLAVRCRPD